MGLTAEDRLEIMDLVARYNLAADEKDVEATLGEYADDGVIEGFYSTGKGKEAMRRDLPVIFEAEGTFKRHFAPTSGSAATEMLQRSPTCCWSSRARRAPPWAPLPLSATNCARWGAGG